MSGFRLKSLALDRLCLWIVTYASKIPRDKTYDEKITRLVVHLESQLPRRFLDQIWVHINGIYLPLCEGFYLKICLDAVFQQPSPVDGRPLSTHLNLMRFNSEFKFIENSRDCNAVLLSKGGATVRQTMLLLRNNIN
jgi:hypothetical protein